MEETRELSSRRRAAGRSLGASPDARAQNIPKDQDADIPRVLRQALVKNPHTSETSPELR
jgi:hypothetical protein